MGKREKIEKKVDDVKDTVTDAGKPAEGMTGEKNVKEEKITSSRRVLNPGTEVELLDLKGGSIGTGAGTMAMAAVGGTGDETATGAYDRSVGPAPARRVGLGAVDRLVEREEHDINFRAASASRVLLDHEAVLFADEDQSVQAAIDSHSMYAQTDIGDNLRQPNFRAEVGMVTTEKIIYVNGQVVNHSAEPCAGEVYPREAFHGTGWSNLGNDNTELLGRRGNFLFHGITLHYVEGAIVDISFATTELPATGELQLIDQLPDHGRVAYNEALDATTIKMRDLVESPANIDKNLYSPLATGFPNTERVQRLKQDIEMTDGAITMLALRSYGNALAVLKRMRSLFGSDWRAHGGFALRGRGSHTPTTSITSIEDTTQYVADMNALLNNALVRADRQATMGPTEYVFGQDSRNKYNSFGSYLVQPRGVLMRLKHGTTAMSKITMRCDKQFVHMVQKMFALSGDGKGAPMMGVTKMLPVIPYDPEDWFYYDRTQCKLRGRMQIGDNVVQGTYGTIQEVVSPLFQSIVDVIVNEVFAGMIRSNLIDRTAGTAEAPATLYIPLDFDCLRFTFAQQLIAHALQWYPHRREASLSMWDTFEAQYGVNPLDMSEQMMRIGLSDILEGSNFSDIASPFKEKPLEKVLELMMMDPEDVKYMSVTEEVPAGINRHVLGVMSHWSRGVRLADPTSYLAGGDVDNYDYLHFQMNWPMLRRNLVAPILDKLFSIKPAEYRNTFDRTVYQPFHVELKTGEVWGVDTAGVTTRELLDAGFDFPQYLTAPNIVTATYEDTNDWRIICKVSDVLCQPRTRGRLAPLPPVLINENFSVDTIISDITRTYSILDGSDITYTDRPIERYNVLIATTNPRTASPSGSATAKIVRCVNSLVSTYSTGPAGSPVTALNDLIKATGYTIAQVPVTYFRDRIFTVAEALPINDQDDASLYVADSQDYQFCLLNYVPWIVNPYNRGVDAFDDQVVEGPGARVYPDDQFYYLFGLAGYTRSDWSRGAERVYGEKMQIYNEIVDKRYETKENLWYS